MANIEILHEVLVKLGKKNKPPLAERTGKQFRLESLGQQAGITRSCGLTDEGRQFGPLSPAVENNAGWLRQTTRNADCPSGLGRTGRSSDGASEVSKITVWSGDRCNRQR
jgi:hypothetical protein